MFLLSHGIACVPRCCDRPRECAGFVLEEALDSCGIGSWGRCPNLADYVSGRSHPGGDLVCPRANVDYPPLKPDVIVATNDAAMAAVRRETQTIPIVMAFSSDPAGAGFVASFARPGGNVFGKECTA